MKTIQMTIDEPLLKRLDHFAGEQQTSRSALIRDAVEACLRKLEIKEKERIDREAYLRRPQDPDEIAEWEEVQYWGDE